MKNKAFTRRFWGLFSYISPRLNTKLCFRNRFGRWPELNQPKTLNEKLLKLKLERYGTDPLVAECADKLRVRDYVTRCGCGEILNELIAVYSDTDEIIWEELPESFALKWNFGCGYNLIVPHKADRQDFDCKRQLDQWKREPFWTYYSELQYRHIPKRLLLEAYLGEEDGKLPEDYKFYCFNGKADCVLVCVGREKGTPKFYFFDKEWNLLRINRDSCAAPEDFAFPKPEHMDEAFAYAERLSKPFPFVRVDLYNCGKGVRFGELTFTPAAGMDNRRLPETDLYFGDKLIL